MALALMLALLPGGAGDVLAAITAPVDESAPRPLKRTILALYDSASARRPHQTAVHEYAELPLNHLGLRLTFVDVRAPLPTLREDDDVRGALVWFDGASRERPGQIIDWLDRLLDLGRKLVVVGEIAGGAGNPQEVRLLTRLGVRLTPDYVAVPLNARAEVLDSDLLEFEHRLLSPLPPYPIARAIPPLGRAALQVARPGQPQSVPDPLVSSAAGAWVADGYSHYVHYESRKKREWRRWYLNPFELFGRAYATAGMPILDTTTLAGRRMYYSHIDGD
ncbi:MAG: hypothetical protein KDK91_19575, partial [Gammaproteobacteria bacterium]|nr:hypothetical protein [Gammaproteobacteria bacterium]